MAYELVVAMLCCQCHNEEDKTKLSGNIKIWHMKVSIGELSNNAKIIASTNERYKNKYLTVDTKR